MKKFLLIIFISCPLISFANCIELNGSYTCSKGKKTVQRELITSIVDGAYVYEFIDENGKSEVHVADGMSRPYEAKERGITIRGEMDVTCDQDSIYSHFIGTVVGLGGKVEVNFISSKVGKNIEVSYEAFFNGRSVRSAEEICIPN